MSSDWRVLGWLGRYLMDEHSMHHTRTLLLHLRHAELIAMIKAAHTLSESPSDTQFSSYWYQVWQLVISLAACISQWKASLGLVYSTCRFEISPINTFVLHDTLTFGIA